MSFIDPIDLLTSAPAPYSREVKHLERLTQDGTFHTSGVSTASTFLMTLRETDESAISLGEGSLVGSIGLSLKRLR